MASIHKEIVIEVPPEHVWVAVRDEGTRKPLEDLYVQSRTPSTPGCVDPSAARQP